MRKEPVVSVGIPCYNRPEGLKRTLECIAGQTYMNLEIIISDNCSPNPDVGRVGREFADKDKRVRYVRQIEDFGAGYNFQFVLDESHGEYFMWACDDDTYSLDYIEKCINRIGNYGCCVTNTVNIKPNGEIYNKYLVHKIEYFESDYKNFLHFLNRISAGYFYALYKRECLLKCLRDKSDHFNGLSEYLALYIYIYCGMIELQEDLYFKLESEDYKDDQISYMKYRDRNRDFITYNLKIIELVNNHPNLNYFEKVDLILISIFRLLLDLSNQLFNSKLIAFIWRRILNSEIRYLRAKCRRFIK
jgi:glycosyltransferase involved in cell wall biosynthesis